MTPARAGGKPQLGDPTVVWRLASESADAVVAAASVVEEIKARIIEWARVFAGGDPGYEPAGTGRRAARRWCAPGSTRRLRSARR